MPCPKYCGACKSTFICSFCLPSSYLYNGQCLQCPIKNCYNCNTTSLITNNTNYCSLCNNKYYLNT